MVKAILKGAITIGLVNIPVKVYVAAKESKVKFKELCPYCKKPLRHLRYCENCKKVIEEKPLKGLEIEKGAFVIFSEEELKEIKLKNFKEIEVIGFIEKEEVDPIHYLKSYYLIPEKEGRKGYFLLKQILEEENKVALVRIIIRNRESLAIIRSYKDALLLTTLYYPYEIKQLDIFEELKEKPLISEEEKKLAKLLVENLTVKPDLSKYKDKFLEKVKELILKKVTSEKKEERKELKEALEEELKKIKEKAKSEK